MIITEVGGQTQISYESYVGFGGDSLGNKFLLTEGFFVVTETGGYRPSPLFVDSTRPVDIEGGLWTFGYRSIAGDPGSYASWTWTQDPPSTPTQPVATNTGANVSMSLDLNRAVARSLRGKESRAAVSLLERQRKLLRDALAAAN